MGRGERPGDGPRSTRWDDQPVAPDGQSEPEARASLGLWLMLASLSAFFAAALVGFAWARVRVEGWVPGLGLAQAPALLLATGFLLGADLLIARARRARGHRQLTRLRAALLLGLLYGVLQAWNWWVLAPVLRGEQALAAFTFVALTGMHAVHVGAGLGWLVLVLVKARRGAYSPSAAVLTARYWRFLSVVWLLVLALLFAS